MTHQKITAKTNFEVTGGNIHEKVLFYKQKPLARKLTKVTELKWIHIGERVSHMRSLDHQLTHDQRVHNYSATPTKEDKNLSSSNVEKLVTTVSGTNTNVVKYVETKFYINLDTTPTPTRNLIGHVSSQPCRQHPEVRRAKPDPNPNPQSSGYPKTSATDSRITKVNHVTKRQPDLAQEARLDLDVVPNPNSNPEMIHLIPCHLSKVLTTPPTLHYSISQTNDTTQSADSNKRRPSPHRS